VSYFGSWSRRLAVTLGLLVLGVSADAHAYHSDRKRVVTGTAFTLHQNEWQLGPFRADYGAMEQLQIGTYVMPLIALIPNLQLKLLIFRNDRWAVSLRPGMYYADLSLPRRFYGLGPEDTTIKLWLFPIEGYVSAVIKKRFVLTFSGVYTAVTGSGSYDPEDFDGTAAASNAQVGLGLQWNINRITALIFQGRYVVFQDAAGAGTVTVHVDDATSADVKASGTANFADATNGWSLSASAFFSWATFNLRVGGGYGNYNVPGMNLVVPVRHPFPVFDAFWRF
jgi:hypothetical protein